MDEKFCHILSQLRKERGVSQRKAAADLHISQALLSHYENGAREPGLMFVCHACDYYGVTADYLLGRGERPTGGRHAAALSEIERRLRELADMAASAAE